MPTIKLVVTDLDNTIYNWVDFYVPSLLAMVRELSRATRINEETLKASFKRVHEHHKTTEYTFAIQELDVLSEETRGLTHRQILDKYDAAIKAFRTTRKQTLRLYDDIIATLSTLKAQGKKIAAATDSLRFHVEHRIKQLGIEDLYDAIVSPPDHGFPVGLSREDVRFYEEYDRYRTKIPIKIDLAPGIRKPDVGILSTLLERFGVRPNETVYIGDSLSRDILMAQRCGAHDVLAKYGHDYDPYHYSELLKVTYWSEKEVEEETRLRETKVTPTFVVGRFSELLEVVLKLESKTDP